MGKIQSLIEQTKELTPEQFQVFLNALGIHRESDPAIQHSDLQIDGYERWESQLTFQEYIFCTMYLQNGLNQGKAAKLTGIHPSSASMWVNHNPNVRQFITNHVNRMAMDAPEMLFHLARIVRLRKADFFDFESETPKLNMKQAIETGAIELAKSVRYDANGWQIQFDDQIKALDILTKTAGLQKDIKITGDIADVARQTGMSDSEIEQYKRMIEDKAKTLRDLIRHSESVDLVVVESDS